MKTLLLIFALSLLAFSASAQEGLLKSVGGAAKSKLESQDFNSSRSNKDKTNLRDEKKSAPAPGAAPSPPPPPPPPAEPASSETLVTADSVVYESSYTFHHQLTYEFNYTDHPDKEHTTMVCYYGDNVEMVQSDKGMSMTGISDRNNESSLMFNEDDKTVMILPTNRASRPATDPETEITITKTGKSKQILDYNCDEYVMTQADKKRVCVCWITSELAVNNANYILDGLMKNKIPVSGEFPANGQMMEMVTYSSDGSAEMFIVVTDYQHVTTIKSLQEYTLITY